MEGKGKREREKKRENVCDNTCAINECDIDYMMPNSNP